MHFHLAIKVLDLLSHINFLRTGNLHLHQQERILHTPRRSLSSTYRLHCGPTYDVVFISTISISRIQNCENSNKQEQKIAISAGAVVITCVATACQKYIQSRYAMSLSVVPTGNALRAEILTSFGANSKSYTIEG